MQYGFGQVEGPVLDTGPGTILYIEDLTVSFDGFKALTASPCTWTTTSCGV